MNEEETAKLLEACQILGIDPTGKTTEELKIDCSLRVSVNTQKQNDELVQILAKSAQRMAEYADMMEKLASVINELRQSLLARDHLIELLVKGTATGGVS